MRQIEAFTQTYSKNRFIVTSRIVGYRDAPIAAEYQVYTLADFSENQIRAFTKKWCPAYERWVNRVEENQFLQDAATKEAEKLFKATRLDEGVKRLAINPLLLTILSLIQRQGIDLPGHRVELYELCTTTLLDTWIKAKRPIEATQFSKNDLIKILRPLAFWMHEHPTIGAIPEEELLEQVVKQLLERNIPRQVDEAQHLAEQFLQTIRGKTGILVERGKQRYGFLHITFEEYFAAGKLVISKKDRDAFIKQHLHDSRWRVVILLTIGIIGILQSDEEGVTELVQESILKAESPFDNWLHRDLIFAGLCLADDVGISIACENTIIEQSVYLYLTSPFQHLRTAFSSVLQAWRGTRISAKVNDLILVLQEILISSITSQSKVSPSFSDKFQFERDFAEYCQQQVLQIPEMCIRFICLSVITVLSSLGIDMVQWVEYALNALSDSDSDVREAAATALGQVGSGQTQVVEALLKLLSDLDSDVRRAAITALGQVGSGQPQVVEALLNALSDFAVTQAIINALTILTADSVKVGRRVEELLARYDFISTKSFSVDSAVNGLFLALQQIMKDV